MTRLSTLPSHREQAHHALVLLGVPAPARLVVDVHGALFDGDLSVPALAALLRDEQRFATTTARHRSAPADQNDGTTGAEATAAFQWSNSGAESPAPAGPDAPAAAGTTGEAGRHGGTARRAYLICPGLQPDLTAARGHLTLSTWPVVNRLCTPAVARAEALAATVRIAEVVAMRPGMCATWLLRRLAESVPGGLEALDPLRPGAVAEVARAALADPALAAAVAAEAPVRDAAARRAARLDERQRLFGLDGLPHQRGGA
jgi:hypothetical protein